MSDASLDGRCGTCARFVRVIERIDENGEVLRAGECLLGVWPAPLYETSTCGEYARKGTLLALARNPPPARPRVAGAPRGPRGSGGGGGAAHAPIRPTTPGPLEIPEELLDMDADEFRQVLRQVIREELGVHPVALGGRWQGGEMVLKPGKEGTAEKRIPLEAFFHKVVMIRDKLRVLEQKINGSAKLEDEEKVQLQQYVTACYGTLTTFNVLFANREDGFTGQKDDA
jgi:hypothetical protein